MPTSTPNQSPSQIPIKSSCHRSQHPEGTFKELASRAEPGGFLSGHSRLNPAKLPLFLQPLIPELWPLMLCFSRPTYCKGRDRKLGLTDHTMAGGPPSWAARTGRLPMLWYCSTKSSATALAEENPPLTKHSAFWGVSAYQDACISGGFECNQST